MSEKMIDLEVKVTMEEMKKIGEYCRDKGVNFSEWMRSLALKEIERRAQEKKEEEKPA
ncbi:hypothetical protein [Hydrogenimonas sp.]|jgi:hypothetical protein|uniref:hypothetical protein n=1 Tax=Hydrogenimonas sp. TaxID=2231112 RepID=UPI002608FCF1|nr:hypothetical protein [Hydrogenimonas sp.]